MSVDQRTRAKAVASSAITRDDWRRIHVALSLAANDPKASKAGQRQWAALKLKVALVVDLTEQAEAALKAAAQRALDNVVADLDRNHDQLVEVLERGRRKRR